MADRHDGLLGFKATGRSSEDEVQMAALGSPESLVCCKRESGPDIDIVAVTTSDVYYQEYLISI